MTDLILRRRCPVRYTSWIRDALLEAVRAEGAECNGGCAVEAAKSPVELGHFGRCFCLKTSRLMETWNVGCPRMIIDLQHSCKLARNGNTQAITKFCSKKEIFYLLIFELCSRSIMICHPSS